MMAVVRDNCMGAEASHRPRSPSVRPRESERSGRRRGELGAAMCLRPRRPEAGAKEAARCRRERARALAPATRSGAVREGALRDQPVIVLDPTEDGQRDQFTVRGWRLG